MEQWKGKVAIVTGASAGIGAAIAQALVHHGMVVVGLARRQEKIQQIADYLAKSQEPGKLYALKANLRKEEDILAAFEWVEKELGGADVLVNNAGLSIYNYIQDGKTEDWRNMWEVNVLAVTICTREYLKSMEKRNNQNGHIFIINSVGAHIHDIPAYAMYTATKYAVKGFSQCLRRELSQKNSTIKVTSISPSWTRTESTTSGQLEQLGSQAILEPSDVAKALIDALATTTVTQICEMIITPLPNGLIY
ncbi:farnesol dehydrogenase-like [Homalodisca vitripennis]|uniref:farnesol dehydrogenase-like n=1 Tax=Homalodisca vitripennis TaxID=197043 RepID=UPI001EEAACAF|nr:farnesol dehydrogenase-like [Homalodisca vitripennis]